VTGVQTCALPICQLEISASYGLLGLTPGVTYSVTFMAEDWSGREDGISVPLPARVSAGARGYPGIIMNEIYSKATPKKSDDWLELYNTGTQPISLLGYELWVDGRLIYTFPNIIILPGQFYVLSGVDFQRGLTFVLTDQLGTTTDQVTMPGNQGTYGRVGAPPYSQWANVRPTPGAINQGQQPIPEWGNVLAVVAIVPIIMIAIRRAKGPRSKDDT
jgi:hypothetical protein